MSTTYLIVGTNYYGDLCGSCGKHVPLLARNKPVRWALGSKPGTYLCPYCGHSLNNGLGLYRFSYNGSDKAFVGVMAQEVQQVMPEAVTHGSDGYLRVNYEKLGLKFQTYDQWLHGARKTGLAPLRH